MTPTRSHFLKILPLCVVGVASTARAEEPAETTTVDFDKGLVFAKEGEKGDFELKATFRLETLFDTTSTAGADERTTNSRFSIERARLTLAGHIYTEKLDYKFQADWGKGFMSLKDFYFDGEVAEETYVRVGQWKKPFSRQQINSSGKLELTSRAITDKAFRGGRDIGVAVHNNYEKSPDTEWIVGVFNGTGDKASFSGDADPMTGEVTGGFSNVPTAWMPAVVGRFGVNKGGIKGYSEADLEGGPMRWAAAVSLYGELDFDRDSTRTHQAEVDFIMKNQGLAASAGVYVAAEQVEGADETPILFGAHAQASKVLGEGTRRMAPAVRYAILVPDGASPTHEVVAGFGFWPYGHNCKVVLDVGTQANTEADEAFGDRFFVRAGFYAGMF